MAAVPTIAKNLRLKETGTISRICKLCSTVGKAFGPFIGELRDTNMSMMFIGMIVLYVWASFS